MAGTRPEILKLAPVVSALAERGRFDVQVCLSGQQGEMARAIARELGVVAAYDLPHEEGPVGLSTSLARLLTRLESTLREARPEGVLVQGDTTTALAGALAAFHLGIPCFHVEAGLRTRDPRRPFPEEMNRRLITRLASLHFAPTEHAKENLLREAVPESQILVTGNPIVDTLQAFGRNGEAGARALLGAGSHGARFVVTLHRRENEEAVASVVTAVRTIAERGDVEVVWVTHPNATGRAAVAALDGVANVRVLPPLSYSVFIALVTSAKGVLTDSGGVQEEAPVLGVPVVVLRAETDRPEAVLAGNAVVVGKDPEAIVAACTALLGDEDARTAQSRATSPFGDGRAGHRIAEAIDGYLSG